MSSILFLIFGLFSRRGITALIWHYVSALLIAIGTSGFLWSCWEVLRTAGDSQRLAFVMALSPMVIITGILGVTAYLD